MIYRKIQIVRNMQNVQSFCRAHSTCHEVKWLRLQTHINNPAIITAS
jgi:hypothetical protein